MSADEAPSEDRHGRILAELAGLSLALARDLQARALEAETAEDATRLATAFHRIARGVRQTLALELKVARFRDDHARRAAEAAAGVAELKAEARDHAHAYGGPVWRRRQDIAREVELLIWTEQEGVDFDEHEADRHQLTLGHWLAGAAERPDFLTADFDDLVIEACEAVGLDPGRIYVMDGEGAEEAPRPPETTVAAGASPDSS